MNGAPHLNNLDLAILGIIGVSVLIAFFRGFVRESMSLATWAVAIYFGVTFCQSASGHLTRWIASEQVRVAVAFFLIFIVLLMIGSVISYFVSGLVKATPLSGIDRFLGMFFGLARGIVLVALLAVAGPFLEVDQSDSWKGSVFLPWVQPLTGWFNQYLPQKELSKIMPVPAEKKH